MLSLVLHSVGHFMDLCKYYVVDWACSVGLPPHVIKRE